MRRAPRQRQPVDAARPGRVQQAEERSTSVDLPAPDDPTSPEARPHRNREVDAADGRDVDVGIREADVLESSEPSARPGRRVPAVSSRVTSAARMSLMTASTTGTLACDCVRIDWNPVSEGTMRNPAIPNSATDEKACVMAADRQGDAADEQEAADDRSVEDEARHRGEEAQRSPVPARLSPVLVDDRGDRVCLASQGDLLQRAIMSEIRPATRKE